MFIENRTDFVASPVGEAVVPPIDIGEYETICGATEEVVFVVTRPE